MFEIIERIIVCIIIIFPALFVLCDIVKSGMNRK